MFGLETDILFPESVLFGWLMGNGGGDKKISSPESEEKYLDTLADIFSRDLLQSFLGSTSEFEKTMKEEELGEEEDIELNLGLSLGGGFGLEPKNLLRSSSTASFLPMARAASDASPSAVERRSSLARTSSLPVETEDEKRKRKELQSLRRMEAKRRRSDKRRGVKGDREMEVNWMGDLERERNLSVMKNIDVLIGGPVLEASIDLGGGIDVAVAKGKGVSGWGSGGMQGFGQVVSQGSSIESTGKSSSNLIGDLEREKHLPETDKLDLSVGGTGFEASSNRGGGIAVAMAKGKGVSGWGAGGRQGFGQVVSQGSSMELTGGSSSSLSDLESKALQGSSGELSPASTLSFRERSKLDVGSSRTEAKEDPSKATGSVLHSSARPSVVTSRAGGRQTRSAVEDMPSVYTRGDCPNGRRVDGILYRYGRGEVRIMCICHATFHSPAEFVLHAGGTNIDNPLRHIVIIPNSSPLL